uniref:Alternative protein ATXN7L3 n=1 Tax=Homo sapiens TaxID=9606 RepID=L8E8Y9_HUMAN|nr:alternative protein ATXN7L3 [Homo sapiens]
MMTSMTTTGPMARRRKPRRESQTSYGISHSRTPIPLEDPSH